MAFVAESGGTEVQMIAALLHDYLEDIEGANPDDITIKFGPEVTKIVEALSDTTKHPKPDWEARKPKYLEKLRDEGGDVKLVSCADKLHNVQCIRRDLKKDGERLWQRFSPEEPKKEKTLMYYRDVLRALSSREWHDTLLDELEREVEELHNEADVPFPSLESPFELKPLSAAD
jgi:hypothetical protein